MHQSDGLGTDLGPDIVGDVGAIFGQEVRLPLARHPSDVSLPLYEVPLLSHPGYRTRNIGTGYGHSIGNSHLGQSEGDLYLIRMVNVIAQVKENPLLDPWTGYGHASHVP